MENMGVIETSGAPDETEAATGGTKVPEPETKQPEDGTAGGNGETAARRVTAEVVEPKAPGEPESTGTALARESVARDLPTLWEANTEQLRLLKTTLVPKGISDDQFQLFVLVARRLNLDPFKRQIYAVPYNNRDGSTQMVIQTGIDGYRAVAARVRDPRTGDTLYDGQDEPQWLDRRGNWTSAWTEDYPPEAARIAVWRKGIGRPFVAVARFKSYAKVRDGQLKDLWATMPDVMIAKCAEALALRKAFPDELGGVYTVEEMEQAENERRPIDSGPTGGTREAPKPSSLSDADRRTMGDAWRAADPDKREAALGWMRQQGFTGDSPRVAAADLKRGKGKEPMSASARIFSHFNFDGSPEQLAVLVRILKDGVVPEAPKGDEGFDPDAVGLAHGETPPTPDAETKAGVTVPAGAKK